MRRSAAMLVALCAVTAAGASACTGDSDAQRDARQAVEGYFALVNDLGQTGGTVELAEFERYGTPDFALNGALDRLTFRENGYTQVGESVVDVREVSASDSDGSGTVTVCLDVSAVTVQFEGRDLPDAPEGPAAESSASQDPPESEQAQVPDHLPLRFGLVKDGEDWLISEQTTTTLPDC